MNSRDPIVRIYNRYRLIAIICIITMAIVICLMTVFPFYSNLKKSSEEEFKRFGTAVSSNIQGFVSEMSNIALQVTSRTKARNTLIAYNNGEMSLHSAGAIIGDILSDVLRQSDIVLGVSRFGTNGELVAGIGAKLPDDFDVGAELSDSEPGFHSHYSLNGQPVVIIDTPIKDRNDRKVGNDLIIFRTDSIKAIMSKSTGAYQGSSISLESKDEKGLHPIYIYGTNIDGEKNEKDAVTNYVIANTDMLLRVSIDAAKLYSLPIHETIRIISLLAGVLLLGSISVFILDSIFRRNLYAEIMLRMARENELLKEKIRFETVMDSLDALVYVADMQTYELIYINHYGREKWGDHSGECCYKLLQGNTVPCSFCTNHLLVDADRKPTGVHVWEVKNCVDQHWYHCRDIAVPWPDGRLVRLEIATDITELKNLECEISELNHNLQERVESEVRQRHNQEQLLIQQSKMAAMGEMIGVIAHQLKQPLNVISLYAQGISEFGEIKDDGIDQLLEMGQVIQDQTVYMDTTINDFRNFFRPAAESVTFNTCKAAGEVYNLIKGKFIRLNVQFHVHELNSSEVTGPPNEFKQVLLNIFSNSLDALEEQDITDGNIDLVTHWENGRLIVKIRDNGGGISEKLLPERLFESYVSTKGEKGTGIGLQISKIIIEEKFRGRLWAHNVDTGAEFVMELPLPDEL